MKKTINLESLTLRQFIVLQDPPLYRPADLVVLTGLPQPRISEILRGLRIYPAGMRKLAEALKIELELLDQLVANSAAERERLSA